MSQSASVERQWTDDEINRRVAEIEGWSQITVTGWTLGDGAVLPLDHPDAPPHDYWRGPHCEVWHGLPPYATDWQWAGPLVEKHEVELNICSSQDENGPWEGWCIRSKQRGYADTPQRAICLAVIAAKGQPT